MTSLRLLAVELYSATPSQTVEAIAAKNPGLAALEVLGPIEFLPDSLRFAALRRVSLRQATFTSTSFNTLMRICQGNLDEFDIEVGALVAEEPGCVAATASLQSVRHARLIIDYLEPSDRLKVLIDSFPHLETLEVRVESSTPVNLDFPKLRKLDFGDSPRTFTLNTPCLEHLSMRVHGLALPPIEVKSAMPHLKFASFRFIHHDAGTPTQSIATLRIRDSFGCACGG
jgi:hypothetical protein